METDWEPIQTGKSDKFGDWSVLGSEYKNSKGKKFWRLQLYSDRYRNIEIYEVPQGAIPVGKRPGESLAIELAISRWFKP